MDPPKGVDAYTMSTEQGSLSARIASSLRKRILSGELPANARLLEVEIAEEMGSSRAPVREALQQLAAEGLVVNQGRRGTIVARFSLQDIEEIYSLRALLESYAVTLLTEQGAAVHCEALRSITLRMDEAGNRGDDEELSQLNVQFHRYIVEHCGNRRLANLWLEMNRQVRMIMLTVTQLYPTLHGVGDYHRLIVDAIASGDSQVAAATIKDHILSTGANLVKQFRRGGVPGLL